MQLSRQMRQLATTNNLCCSQSSDTYDPSRARGIRECSVCALVETRSSSLVAAEFDVEAT